ncbi:isoliquiritigenin 2'-O-methyltransferase-like [Senna tora]|uniref:Isoliquiritigenin 2'-O-methyltransferase-like n=1 Tax=Senna tora TaxID=362788 RepID=A0A834VZ18_9FABA|nr:isoliquiritigenin 2'-O-methyltransferase-like [Senna tora]
MAFGGDNNNNHHKEDDSSFTSALTLCFSQIQSAALNTAIELNLFNIIARANGRHVSVTEIVSELPTSAQHQDLAFRLSRLLRLLAFHSLLTCSCDDTTREPLYGISPIGKFFVSDHYNTSGSVALMPLFLTHRALLDTWLNFKNAIIEEDADAFKKVHGIPLYKYSQTDPKLNTLFNQSMEDLSFILLNRVLELYKGFEGISTLVDVGGGIEHIGGDMFAGVPKGGDAILLKNVLHNWSDENSIKILKKCHEALGENGKVIVLELIMPEVMEELEDGKFVSGLDNLMFIIDGRERTEKEFESLCKRSGFSAFKVASRAYSVQGVMEFYK